MNKRIFAQIGFFTAAFISTGILFQNCSQPGSIGLASVNTTSVDNGNDIGLIRDPITLISTPSILINNGNKYTQSEEVSLSLSAKGAEQMQISNDETCSENSEWISFSENKSWKLLQTNSLASVSVKFRKRGVPETSCIKANIFHDNTAPSLALLNEIPIAINLSQYDILFSTKDNSNDFVNVTCELPNQKSIPCIDHFLFSSFPNDGTYSVVIKAKDQAGNVSQPLSVTLVVDRIAPEIKITGPNGVIAEKNLSYLINVSDSNQIKYAQCRLVPLESEFKDCSKLRIDYSNLNAGKYSFQVKAADIAGNQSSTSLENEIDLTVPTVTITQMPNNYSNQASVSFSFSGLNGTQPIQKFLCSFDDSTPVSCKSPYNVAISKEGLHSFVVIGVNDLNVSSTPQSYQFVSDMTAPILKIVSGPTNNEVQKNNSPTFALEAADSSGLKSLACFLNGQSLDCSKKSVTYSNLPDGVYNFKAQAIDLANNSSVTSLITWKIDTTPDSLVSAAFSQSPIKENAAANLNITLVSVTNASYICQGTVDNQLVVKGNLTNSGTLNFAVTSDLTCVVSALNKKNEVISKTVSAEVSCGNKLKSGGKCADFQCNSIINLSVANTIKIPARTASGVCYALKIFDAIANSNSNLTKIEDKDIVSRTHGGASDFPTRNPYLMNRTLVNFNLEGPRVVKLAGGLSTLSPILSDNYILVGVYPQAATPLVSHYAAYGTTDSTIPNTNYILFKKEPVILTPFGSSGTATISPLEIVREADTDLNYNLDVRTLDCGGIREQSNMYLLFQ
ncbi:MAG: Ig-like domain-containing protein [Bdellovibrionaceae bacterium]|nr:Ig-like domain-containing protein [Pseudobdellovibrionaceae bacterium]NUM60295.1 hypothetical protein [Pseudobdellovibrionaceae bacterium]